MQTVTSWILENKKNRRYVICDEDAHKAVTKLLTAEGDSSV